MAKPTANEPHFTCQVAGNTLRVVKFKVQEKISTLFRVDLDLAAEEEVGFDDVIGQAACLTVEGLDGERHFHGIVSQFAQTGVSGRFLLYQAVLVPSAWLLSLEKDCRIFQKKTIQQIVQQVFEESGIASDAFAFRLQGNYPAREYCVQYRETDLAFISRLLEQEGIFYFFEHTDQGHTMVFGDGTVNYQPISGQAQVEYNAGGQMVAEEEAVIQFDYARRLRSGKTTLRDFNFEKPSLDLTSDKTDSENDRREIYDFPGRYTEQDDGRHLAQVRLEEAVMYKNLGSGSSVCPRFVPGFTFALQSHPVDNLNQEYLLVSADHEGEQPQALGERAASGAGTRYQNQFVAVPSSVTIRPERTTPRPRIDGVQTAIVVGPQGDEIHTDKLGRVKVQFHWDRLGQKDENSSCWIRVSQNWAGSGWGAMFIPRIGHEVIVDFIEGNPDRPIITGRVYHGTNTPPYPLPDEKTKSVIKSESSTGGGGFNEIRLEDKAGSEEIYIHGQKDWNIIIQNDKGQNIGHDEKLEVGNNQTVKINKDCSEKVGGKKNVDITGDHNRKAGANETVKVTAKRDFSSATENHKVKGARTVDVKGPEKHSVTTAMNFSAKTEDHTVNAMRTLKAGVEQKTVTGQRTFTANVENYTVTGARTLTVGTETKTITNQTQFLGMDVTTDSGAKFENFAGIKVSNAFALLAELKQINISVVNAAIGYTSFKLDQTGIEVKTSALHVIG